MLAVLGSRQARRSLKQRKKGEFYEYSWQHHFDDLRPCQRCARTGRNGAGRYARSRRLDRSRWLRRLDRSRWLRRLDRSRWLRRRDRSAGSSAAPKPAAPGAAPAANVDVAAILTKLAASNKEKLDWQKSIVDLMKLLNLDSSLTARKQLATELHYSGNMNDSASMNIWLHKQVMQKLAENGGKVPDSLRA